MSSCITLCARMDLFFAVRYWSSEQSYVLRYVCKTQNERGSPSGAVDYENAA